MAAYGRELPRDKNLVPMQEYPAAYTAIKRSSSENASASSVITVSSITTVLEVTTVGAPAVLKWITTTDTTASVISDAGTANFDHVIPTGTQRRFVIPIERAGVQQPSGSVLGINAQMGLYQRFAIKNMGVGSILTSEF